MKTPHVQPVLMIHGGLSRSGRNRKERQQSLRHIAERGYEFLRTHTAMESAVHIVRMLEDEPLFNAGTGSTIQSDGVIRMSASLMDGQIRRFSGVMNVEHIQNPITLAAALQQEQDRILAADPARHYADKLGMPFYNPETQERRAEFERHKATILPIGTVGCVALDMSGKLAAATSTGGKGWEIPGRVGDSPTIAGNFANGHCAVSATGVGEDIINAGLACALVTRVTDGVSLAAAGEKALEDLGDVKGYAGFIALTATGETLALANLEGLGWAKASAEGVVTF